MPSFIKKSQVVRELGMGGGNFAPPTQKRGSKSPPGIGLKHVCFRKTNQFSGTLYIA